MTPPRRRPWRRWVLYRMHALEPPFDLVERVSTHATRWGAERKRQRTGMSLGEWLTHIDLRRAAGWTEDAIDEAAEPYYYSVVPMPRRRPRRERMAQPTHRRV